MLDLTTLERLALDRIEVRRREAAIEALRWQAGGATGRGSASMRWVIGRWLDRLATGGPPSGGLRTTLGPCRQTGGRLCCPGCCHATTAATTESTTAATTESSTTGAAPSGAA